MSKLIIEMKMPKCCWDCSCCDGEYGYCAASRKQLDDLNERPDWCPIKGEVEYARMVHERIMDEIKDNVSMRRLEEELFVLCKEAAERKDDGK